MRFLGIDICSQDHEILSWWTPGKCHVRQSQLTSKWFYCINKVGPHDSVNFARKESTSATKTEWNPFSQGLRAKCERNVYFSPLTYPISKAFCACKLRAESGKLNQFQTARANTEPAKDVADRVSLQIMEFSSVAPIHFLQKWWGEVDKKSLTKFIFCDHVCNSHDRYVLQSIDITRRNLMLITLRPCYTNDIKCFVEEFREPFFTELSRFCWSLI